jgi:hypothetical protein
MGEIGRIRKRMGVVAADGQLIGFVSRIVGDRIRLTSVNAGHAYDHLVPLAWVTQVDSYVYLGRTSRYIGDHWENVAPSRRNPPPFDLAASLAAVARPKAA